MDRVKQSFMRLCVAFFSYLPLAALMAEQPEILNRIRDYDMRHSDLLVKIVKDPETLRVAKVRALEKMSVIYRQSGKQGDLVATRYLQGIRAGLQHNSPEVREAACTVMVVFPESAIATQIAEAAAMTLREETNPQVVEACARSLRQYPKHAAVVAPALLVRLDKYLTEFQDSAADERALRQICRTLAAMRWRKSFIPLLKLLQSRYDEDVKRAAQEAIHAIRVQ
jgi:HEAT repeat protein